MVKEFGDAFRDVGFVAVKADSLNSIMPKVWKEMKIYFNQSLDEKNKDLHGNFFQSGFAPQGAETAAGAKYADNKEFFHVPPKWPEGFRAPPSILL